MSRCSTDILTVGRGQASRQPRKSSTSVITVHLRSTTSSSIASPSFWSLEMLPANTRPPHRGVSLSFPGTCHRSKRSHAERPRFRFSPQRLRIHEDPIHVEEYCAKVAAIAHCAPNALKVTRIPYTMTQCTAMSPTYLISGSLPPG